MTDEEQALEESRRLLQQFQWNREAARKRARYSPRTGKLLPRTSRNAYIRDSAIIREPIGRHGAELWITYIAGREEFLRLREDPLLMNLAMVAKLCDPDALNGYVVFSRRDAPDPGGLKAFIPVHGGITYAEKDKTAAVWGFDTTHFNSEEQPRTDPEWIRYQCHVLHHCLQVADELWPVYRRERNPQKRAALLEKLVMIEEASGTSVQDRLGTEALLRLLTGNV